MIALAIVLVLNYLGVRLAIRAMLTFATRLVHPDADPRRRDHRQGRRRTATRCRCSTRARRRSFGVTGGGVLGGILLGILLFVGFEAAASIGEESEDPHRSIPRAVIGTVAVAAAFFVFMAYAFSIGYGKKAVSEGAWAFSPGAGQRDGDQVRRLVVRDDPRARRHPRRDGARARDLRHDRSRLLRARPRRPAADGLREDVAPRHAVGREPDGRRRRHRPDRCSSCRDELRDAVRLRRPGRTEVRAVLPERPVRDVHPLGDDRLVRDRARLPRPRGRRVQARAASGNKLWQYARSSLVAVATPILGFYGALKPEPHDRSNFNWVAAYWTIGADRPSRCLVRDRRS